MTTLSTPVPGGSRRREPEGSAPWAASTPRSRATTARADATLLHEVQRHGRFDSSCLNCGGCSVACDLSQGHVTFPRLPIRRVILGVRDDVVAGLEPWLCHDCGDCSQVCPRQADPAESLRTLRRYLTGQYDWTGLASRILSSRAWHAAALAVPTLIVVGLFIWYHVYRSELGWASLKDPIELGHMFPKVVYFTWVVYALPAVILLAHVWRMLRFTMRGSMPAVRHFVAEAKTLFVHVTTQWHMRKCPTEARDAPVVGWWLYSGGDTVVPRRWLKHWLMVFGTVTMVVVTAAFLPWFQTDVIHPITHPQRWLGYLATLAMLWGTTDLLVRRARRPRAAAGGRRVPLALPAMLWLSAASGIVLHLARISGLALTTHYAYLVHLCIVVPMVVVEVPFGDWAHMIDRPMALYLQAVRERARRATPVQPAPAPAQP